MSDMYVLNLPKVQHTRAVYELRHTQARKYYDGLMLDILNKHVNIVAYLPKGLKPSKGSTWKNGPGPLET